MLENKKNTQLCGCFSARAMRCCYVVPTELLLLYAINSHLSTFLTKKIKGVNKPPCMRVGTKPTINNLAVEFATLLSIICDKNTFVNTFSKKIKASVFYTLAIVGLTIP